MTAERTRRETFAGLVSLKTITLGGFNYWEISNMVQHEGSSYDIYSGQVALFGDRRGRVLHIVVGKKREEDQTTWYFGTFRGPAWSDMTSKEHQRYSERELGMLKDKYRVAGGRLESLIRQAAAFDP